MQNQSTSIGLKQTKQNMIHKDIIKDKYTLRGFKSLNRKGVQSPKNSNCNIVDNINISKLDKMQKLEKMQKMDRMEKVDKMERGQKVQRYEQKNLIKTQININNNNKENIKDNINANSIHKIHGPSNHLITVYADKDKAKKSYSQLVQTAYNGRNSSSRSKNKSQQQSQCKPSSSSTTAKRPSSSKLCQSQQQHCQGQVVDIEKQCQQQIYSLNTNNRNRQHYINNGQNKDRLTTNTNTNANTNANTNTNANIIINNRSNSNHKHKHSNPKINNENIHKKYVYQNSPSISIYKSNNVSSLSPNIVKNQQYCGGGSGVGQLISPVKQPYVFTSTSTSTFNTNTSTSTLNININTNTSPSSSSSTPSPSNIGTIIHETTSKDGQYKIISRSLINQQLRQAVQLQTQINHKTKKQIIKQLSQISQYNVSPRNRYLLDPSKVSNKQNGNIKAYSVNSNQGISRKYNEDRVSIILNITKNGVKASYFAIYDGHGGSNCCDYLTQNLHQFIFNSKKFPSNPRAAIIQGIKLAEDKFIEKVKQQYLVNKEYKQLDRSGSCAIITLIVGDDCYIANLGDSRAVLSTCQGKPMYSLSRDHKPTDVGEQTRILKEGGKIYRTEMFKIKRENNKRSSYGEQQNKTHPKNQKSSSDNNTIQYDSNQVIIGPLRAYPGKLSVTRTFGDIQAKQSQFGGIKNCISTDPQICKYTLTGKQDFILLGCDGIFEKLDSEEVIDEAWRTIKKHKNNNIHQAVGAAAQSIVKLCMDRKSTDNLTIIMICLGNLGIGIGNNLNDYASV